MTQYYLDIETSGLDFNVDKIITIQYQELNFYGVPIKPLVILKEWESNEETIVREFYHKFMDGDLWSFVSIGFNLAFDISFLWTKFEKYNLPLPFDFKFLMFNGRKFIDLQSCFIIANNMSFRGSSLDQMTSKEQDGKKVPEWYNNREYDKIIEYIKQETQAFLEVLAIIKEDLKLSKLKWKKK
jgi:hypothetical protein